MSERVPEPEFALPLSTAVDDLLLRVWLASRVNVDDSPETFKAAPLPTIIFGLLLIEAEPVRNNTPLLITVSPL